MNGKVTTFENEQATLKVYASALAEKRQEYEGAKLKLDAMRAEFDEENSSLITTVNRLSLAAKAEESTLRIAALNTYHATDEKKLIPGVEIKLWDSAEYDMVEALQWCRLNMPALLVLNTKTYEKVLRVRADNKGLQDALPDMPGIVGDGPKTSIAKDLSEYLPVSEGEEND